MRSENMNANGTCAGTVADDIRGQMEGVSAYHSYQVMPSIELWNFVP